MYMMQGDSRSRGAPPTPDAAAAHAAAQHQIRSKYFPTGTPANMNLDALLGNEEWTGLPADRTPLEGGGSYVSPAIASTEGAFRSKNAQGQQGGNGAGLQFGDLTPGMLGWGLEGF